MSAWQLWIAKPVFQQSDSETISYAGCRGLVINSLEEGLGIPLKMLNILAFHSMQPIRQPTLPFKAKRNMQKYRIYTIRYTRHIFWLWYKFKIFAMICQLLYQSREMSTFSILNWHKNYWTKTRPHMICFLISRFNTQILFILTEVLSFRENQVLWRNQFES